ncbi:MAG: hypothetical protein ACHRXM_34455 [Isosphaerales bacterium]
MQMTQLAMIASLWIVGPAVTGAAVHATQKRESVKPAVPATVAAREREPGKPAAPVNKVKMVTVRVVDIKGRDVPDVEVVNVDPGSAYDSAEVRYRTGADGRFRAPVDPNDRRFAFRAHPDDRTLGWANISMANLWPEATDKNPVTLVLLPLNHRVEGSIRDKRGKPIRGVQVRVNQLLHDANNGFGRGTSLGSAVTDLAGRYAISVPRDTVVTFAAHHPRYVGPSFSCGPDDRAIAAVTLEDAGGIAGTVIDSTTGKPVEGVRVGAQLIEIKLDEPLGGGGGVAFSDARGHFQAGGLAPGVYNLLFMASPKGRRLTARAVEGVRVKAGEDSRADLVMIEGRRLLGTAIHVFVSATTDRMGLFRLKGLPPGELELELQKDGYGSGRTSIPPGAWEVDLALPGQPDPLE